MCMTLCPPCSVWAPERSFYERPLFFEYNSTAAEARVSFIKWHQTAEGYIISPERVLFLKSNEKARFRCPMLSLKHVMARRSNPPSASVQQQGRLAG